MLALRSILFQVVFYGLLVGFMLACLPAFALPRRYGRACMQAWARTSEAALGAIAGLRFEVRGREHVPRGGAIVAAKHQSAWETVSLLHILPDPAMVLKRELLYLPVFGWYALKFAHLGVDRSGGARALRSLLGHARRALGNGRQVVIFPEGTRRAPGAPPAYQRGVVALYRDLDVPCVPVALNSGVFWRRRDWRRRPGTIVIEFLEPIPPGLDGRSFLATLEARIEPATARLVAEAEGRMAAVPRRGPSIA